MSWFGKKKLTEEERICQALLKNDGNLSEQDARILARAKVSGLKLYGPHNWNGYHCPACGARELIVRKLMEKIVIPPIADPTLKIESRVETNDGFFCIRCGTELECNASGCVIGQPFIVASSHQIRVRQKDARNFFSLLKDAVELGPERAHGQLLQRRAELLRELEKVNDRLLEFEVEKEMRTLDEELSRARNLLPATNG